MTNPWDGISHYYFSYIKHNSCFFKYQRKTLPGMKIEMCAFYLSFWFHKLSIVNKHSYHFMFNFFPSLLCESNTSPSHAFSSQIHTERARNEKQIPYPLKHNTGQTGEHSSWSDRVNECSVPAFIWIRFLQRAWLIYRPTAQGLSDQMES